MSHRDRSDDTTSPSPAPSPRIETWCDYFRGVASAAEIRRCEETIAASPGALAELAWLRRVSTVGRSDSEHEIPAAARRVVRALGSIRRPAAVDVGSRWRRLPAWITFDSRSAPAVAGVRDALPVELDTALPHQLVFESEELAIEVRIEAGRRDGGLVAGQVVRRDQPETPVSHLPILITADDRVICQTVSGELGEFYGEGLPDAALRLRLVLDDNRLIELPLAGAPENEDRDTIASPRSSSADRAASRRGEPLFPNDLLRDDQPASSSEATADQRAPHGNRGDSDRCRG